MYLSIFVHTEYVLVINIFLPAAKNIPASSKKCYSASDSTQSCCSTYTPYKNDIVKHIIMPYDVLKIQGVSFQGKNLYTGLVFTKTVYVMCMYVYK
jgi:hypothetical protein